MGGRRTRSTRMTQIILNSEFGFNPDGSFLAVTEKVANQIVVFPVQADDDTYIHPARRLAQNKYLWKICEPPS